MCCTSGNINPAGNTVLPPLKPIAMKERISMIFIEYGEIDVLDGAGIGRTLAQSGPRRRSPTGIVRS